MNYFHPQARIVDQFVLPHWILHHAHLEKAVLLQLHPAFKFWNKKNHDKTTTILFENQPSQNCLHPAPLNLTKIVLHGKPWHQLPTHYGPSSLSPFMHKKMKNCSVHAWRTQAAQTTFLNSSVVRKLTHGIGQQPESNPGWKKNNNDIEFRRPKNKKKSKTQMTLGTWARNGSNEVLCFPWLLSSSVSAHCSLHVEHGHRPRKT